MDVYKTYKEFNSGVNEMEILVHLTVTVALITISLLYCCCCCCLWINSGDPINSESNSEFDSRILLQEIEDIEHQSENYEEELRRARKRRRRQLGIIEEDNITSDVNDDIGIRSDSWEANEESYIGEYANEYVIINTDDPDDRSGDTLDHTKDSDLNCSSGDLKDVPNVSKDNDIKSNNDEDIVDKCDSSNKTSHQVDKLCGTSNETSNQCSQDDCDKSNVEDYNNKCNASNGSGKVDTED
ncbi:uncharacterized protein [Choristoneura fumiferana]|uniref:uncharacterized protein n=1 Tax=Choristoneura fumiferana TaxID=7141 RepID=UPI003D157136